jgi:hypothetical protein
MNDHSNYPGTPVVPVLLEGKKNGVNWEPLTSTARRARARRRFEPGDLAESWTNSVPVPKREPGQPGPIYVNARAS